MISVGRLCMKIAGRDAGKHCLIVDVLDKRTVLIDGETRRRKCNINHLEPLDKAAKLTKNASHYAVIEELKKLGVKVREKKVVPRQKKAETPKAAPEKKAVKEKPSKPAKK